MNSYPDMGTQMDENQVASNIMMNMAMVSQMSDERITGYPQP